VADLIGQRIGNYRIESLLGAGGMGRVYRGVHLHLDRRAAIKLLRPELAEDAGFVRRFLREARIAAQLHHPNIVEIYDTGEAGGHYFIAMRLVDGRSLRAILDERRLAVSETVRYVHEIAAALDHAHARGIVHRDVKPGNIIIDGRDHVMLVDFGIAKALEDLAATSTLDATAVGAILGTPAYLAPEQATGGPVTAQTDIYALGCVVYEMLAGSPPFAGRVPHAVVAAHLQEAPLPVHERRPDLPPAVNDVILRALAKGPAERFATAGAFAEALSWAAGQGDETLVALNAAAPVANATALDDDEERRLDPLFWFGAGAAVLVLLAVAFLFWPRDDGDTGAVATIGDAASVTQTSLSAPSTAPVVTATDAAGATEGSGVPATATIEGAPAPPPPGTSILFTSAREGAPDVPDLYVMTPDGEGERSLTGDDGDDSISAWQPDWSPGGARIALTRAVDGNNEVYVADAGGANQLRLTDDPADDQLPRWSPDGQRIAFVSDRDGHGEIYVINLDGSGLANLTRSPGGDFSHSWSPDGSRILFVSNRDGNNEIYSMDADGTDQHNLSRSPGPDSDPVWSPDGSRIAFMSRRDGNVEIYVMNADGTGQTNITNSPADDLTPNWSPDGEWIAFASELGGRSNIQVMRADGSERHAVAVTPGSDRHPSWSPDSRWVAFAGTVDGNSDIYIASIAGDDLRRLTGAPGFDGTPFWSPVASP
jgi:TolB protein